MPLLALPLFVGSMLPGARQAQPAGPPPLTVLRIAAGPHGEVRNGNFVLDEERTQFDPSKDKEVVVYFQWQGQPGLHRMTAQWKSPDGASSTTSPIQYDAKDQPRIARIARSLPGDRSRAGEGELFAGANGDRVRAVRAVRGCLVFLRPPLVRALGARP